MHRTFDESNANCLAHAAARSIAARALTVPREETRRSRTAARVAMLADPARLSSTARERPIDAVREFPINNATRELPARAALRQRRDER